MQTDREIYSVLRTGSRIYKMTQCPLTVTSNSQQIKPGSHTLLRKSSLPRITNRHIILSATPQRQHKHQHKHQHIQPTKTSSHKMFAKAPSPRPTAQQNTRLLRALFTAEEERQLDPYTRRPSPSPSTSRRSSFSTAQAGAKSQDQSPSQYGILHAAEEKVGAVESN